MLWTFPNAEYIGSLPEPHAFSVHAGVFSASGRMFAAGGKDGSIRVWDVSNILNPALRYDFPAHSEHVRSLSFSPDEKYIFSGGKDGIVRTDLFSKEVWRARAALPVNSVSVSSDGRLLAGAGDEPVVRVWSLHESREPLLHKCLRGHTDAIHSVAFRPDGDLLASVSSDNSIRIWDGIAGRGLRSVIGSGRWVYSVAYCKSAGQFAVSSQDGFARLWDPDSANFIELSMHSEGAVSVAASPAGDVVASGSYDGSVSLWFSSTGKSEPGQQHNHAVMGLAFSDDGELLASASQHSIQRWNRTTLKPLRPLSGLGSRLGSIAFQPRTHNLAVSRDDGTAQIFGEDDRSLQTDLGRHAGKIRSLAFHPDGQILAIAGDGRDVDLWDMSAGQPARASLRLDREAGFIGSIAFAPDGTLLAAGDRTGFVTLWDFRTRQFVHSWKAHPSSVNCVAFGESSARLATVGRDGFVNLWTTDSFQLVKTAQIPLPCDGVDIRQASGLTVLQRTSLQSLGARDEIPGQSA